MGSQEGGNTREENREREEGERKGREKIENTKGCEVSASRLLTFSTLAAAQIYRLFILHQVSAPNGKKRITFKLMTKDIQ